MQLSPNLLALKDEMPSKALKDPASKRVKGDEADASVGSEEFAGLDGIS